MNAILISGELSKAHVNKSALLPTSDILLLKQFSFQIDHFYFI